MKTAWLKQFGLAFCVMLSLFASSVSACACAHHQEKTQTNSPSCHENSVQTKTENHHETDSSETIKTTVSETECCCMSPAPRVTTKTESIKFEKQIAAIPFAALIENKTVSQIFSVKIDFTKPFYLSDSFYNISPGRAPPRS
jgi:hypothetical protein